MPLTASLPDVARTLTAALFVAGQGGLLAYASHRWWLIRARSAPPVPPVAAWAPGSEPAVLVQLPVRDEGRVVGRLLEAVSALDWPRERLRVQLLDDSGEAEAALSARAVERAAASGLRIEHVRRGSRRGYKAGALAHGLAGAEEPFVAVFDADFVPAPDFLRRLMPHLADPRVGLVQARWGHLDRDSSLLRRAQAVLLDAHLFVEQVARQAAGCWFNFNGTAGIWRRACIEDAGGWQHDTLTEDLDLSYRAQLAGWRFVFDPTVEVPAELPADMRAFRSQQHRWVKGAFQTARKLLPRVWSARLPLRLQLEATVHLTANLVYPLLLVMLLLTAPLLLTGSRWPAWALFVSQLLLFAVGTLPVVWFLAEGQRRAGRQGIRRAADVGLALLLCGGLSWWLTRAVVEGLFGATGEFVRTPKWGSLPAADTGRQVRRVALEPGWVESAGGLGCVALSALAWHLARAEAMPFLLALAAGSLWVGLAMAGRVRAS